MPDYSEGIQIKTEDADPRFNNALARGLAILRAFQVDRRLLGNRELAEITLHSIPKDQRVKLFRTLLGYRLRHRAPIPPVEYRPRGRLHSKSRDANVISHHYDVSNRFYSWVLGPSMAYTCAVYPEPDASLEEAQEEKVDLVCRKLDLQPGQRLLDVGCGWGAMVRHAAEHYGARVIGVTLSRQ